MPTSALRHVIGYTTVLLLAVAGTAQALPDSNTVASDDIINGQVKRADLAGGAVNGAKVANGSLTGLDLKDGSVAGVDIRDGSVGPTDLSQAYYSKAEVDALLAGYVERRDLGTGGTLRWGYVRDGGAGYEVYVDDSSSVSPELSVVQTATGVWEVTVPGVAASGGFHSIFVSPQQGQASVFRACKTFQTVAATQPAGALTVRVRCYDAAGALADTNFHILVLQ